MRPLAPLLVLALAAGCAAKAPPPAPAAHGAAGHATRADGRALPAVQPGAATGPAPVSAAPARCADDAGWNDPATPVRIHGDTWYVGTCGIAALLVTSAAGHVLLDAGTENAASQVIANVRALGFDVADIRYIVNSHAHLDHAGGIAALQQASGATVVAMADALPALRSGRSEPGDPQHGTMRPYPAVGAFRPIGDGEVLRLGPLALTAHATSGHAPGGTSWTWRSCEGDRCLDMAFVDSLTAVAAPGYRFGDAANAGLVASFGTTFERVAGLPCDVLVTPHPQASALWSRLGPGASRPLADAGACRAYAEAAAARLQARLAQERARP